MPLILYFFECDTAVASGLLAIEFVFISGLKVTYNLDRPEGSRVLDLQVLCNKCSVPRFVPIEDDVSYQFILPTYLVKGGDGYTMVKDHLTKHHIYGEFSFSGIWVTICVLQHSSIYLEGSSNIFVEPW